MIQALYTETFHDFIADQDTGYLTEIFADYPDYVFGTSRISFESLICLRYELQEIGAETPDRFDALLRAKAAEVYVNLAPVLGAYMANIENLTERTVEDTDTRTTYDYINPMNAEAVDTGAARLSGSQKEKIEKRVFVNLSSPAEQVKQIADLYHIYGDAVEEFAPLFMGVF